ncbi:MAG: 3-hydroxyacyl-CoA dehydrogenase family protein [Candidatus Bathyarchaeia archaeon]
MVREAITLLEQGVATKEDIDTAMKLGFNHPLGPVELADYVGLDTTLYAMDAVYQEFGDPRYKPPLLLKQLVKAGYLGRKSGRGFYEY